MRKGTAFTTLHLKNSRVIPMKCCLKNRKRGGIDAFVQSVIGNRNNVLLKSCISKGCWYPPRRPVNGCFKDHAGQSNDETLHQVDDQDRSNSSAVDNNSTSFSKSRDENDSSHKLPRRPLHLNKKCEQLINIQMMQKVLFLPKIQTVRTRAGTGNKHGQHG